MKFGNRTSTRALCSAALLMASALTTHSLHAQALPTAAGPGSYVAVGGGVSAFQEDYGQQVIGGALVYVDANLTWRYGFEAEARYLRYHTSEDVTEKNYLGGVRVQLWKPTTRIRPYAKFLVGVGDLSFPFHYGTSSNLAYAPGGGLDIALGDRWTVRAVDFEYQLWPNFVDQTAQGVTYSELKPYGVSFGISYRINGVDRYPKNAYRVERSRVGHSH